MNKTMVQCYNLNCLHNEVVKDCSCCIHDCPSLNEGQCIECMKLFKEQGIDHALWEGVGVCKLEVIILDYVNNNDRPACVNEVIDRTKEL